MKSSAITEQARHIETLARYFGSHINAAAFRALRTLEKQCHKVAEDYCNGKIGSDEADELSARALVKVRAILGATVPVFVNLDPRGYALKLAEADRVTLAPELFRDWGGYGIIAPEF